MEQIFADPQYDPGFGILLDRRAIQESVDSEFVRNVCRLMDSRKATSGPIRWALLVSDVVSFGMGRMAEQLSEHQHFFRPFQDLKAAEAWLARME